MAHQFGLLQRVVVLEPVVWRQAQGHALAHDAAHVPAGSDARGGHIITGRRHSAACNSAALPSQVQVLRYKQGPQ